MRQVSKIDSAIEVRIGTESVPVTLAVRSDPSKQLLTLTHNAKGTILRLLSVNLTVREVANTLELGTIVIFFNTIEEVFELIQYKNPEIFNEDALLARIEDAEIKQIKQLLGDYHG